MKTTFSKSKVATIVIINHVIAISVLVAVMVFIVVPFVDKFHPSPMIAVFAVLVISFIATVYVEVMTKYINSNFANHGDEFYFALGGYYL